MGVESHHQKGVEGLSPCQEAGRADGQTDGQTDVSHPTSLPIPNQSADRAPPPPPSHLVHRKLLIPSPACRPLWSLVSRCCFCLCSVGGAFSPGLCPLCVPPGSLCPSYPRSWFLGSGALSTLPSPLCLCPVELGYTVQALASWPPAPPLPGHFIHRCQSPSNHDALTCGTCTGGPSLTLNSPCLHEHVVSPVPALFVILVTRGGLGCAAVVPAQPARA